MQPAGARTQRGRANDEVILDAALAAAYRLGVDGYGLKDVATEAGLTSGAVYGRYESVGESQADLWQHRLLPALQGLLADIRAAVDSDFADEPVAAALASSPLRTLALLACTIAGRTDELGDLAPDDLRLALSEQRLLPSQGTDFELATLSLILGNHLHAQREAGCQITTAELSGALRSAARSLRGAPPKPILIPEPRFAVPNDPAAERLINALAKVVARAGLHRATVRRIARAAGSSHTVVYASYGSLHGLVEDFVRVVGNSRPAPAAVAERYLSLERMGGFLTGATLPSARELRRLSLEFVVGVSPSEELAKMVSDFDTATYEAAAATFARRGSRQFKAFVRLARVVRAVNFGSMLLQETVGGCEEVDFRPVLAPFLRQVSG